MLPSSVAARVLAWQQLRMVGEGTVLLSQVVVKFCVACEQISGEEGCACAECKRGSREPALARSTGASRPARSEPGRVCCGGRAWPVCDRCLAPAPPVRAGNTCVGHAAPAASSNSNSARRRIRLGEVRWSPSGAAVGVGEGRTTLGRSLERRKSQPRAKSAPKCLRLTCRNWKARQRRSTLVFGLDAHTSKHEGPPLWGRRTAAQAAELCASEQQALDLPQAKVKTRVRGETRVNLDMLASSHQAPVSCVLPSG